MKLTKKLLLKTYKLWSRIVPSAYRLYSLPTGGQVYIDVTESKMMFLRVIGRYEPHKHRALDFFLQEGDSCIDIGANKGDIGIHAALTVGEQGRVLMFEPEPENCKWVKKSIEASNVKNIELVKAAAGAKDGFLELHIGKRSGGHTLMKRNYRENRESVMVKVLQLSKYLERNPLPNLKVIKIDVEGFEKEVLNGARELLAGSNDLVLLIDIHPIHEFNHTEIYELLQTCGFSLYRERYPYNRPVLASDRPRAIVAVKRLK